MELFSGSQNVFHKERPLDQWLDAEIHTLSVKTSSVYNSTTDAR
jgi:hypothetical protein